jgi:hypothetical protein
MSLPAGSTKQPHFGDVPSEHFDIAQMPAVPVSDNDLVNR